MVLLAIPSRAHHPVSLLARRLPGVAATDRRSGQPTSSARQRLPKLPLGENRIRICFACSNAKSAGRAGGALRFRRQGICGHQSLPGCHRRKVVSLRHATTCDSGSSQLNAGQQPTGNQTNIHHATGSRGSYRSIVSTTGPVKVRPSSRHPNATVIRTNRVDDSFQPRKRNWKWIETNGLRQHNSCTSLIRLPALPDASKSTASLRSRQSKAFATSGLGSSEYTATHGSPRCRIHTRWQTSSPSCNDESAGKSTSTGRTAGFPTHLCSKFPGPGAGQASTIVQQPANATESDCVAQ